MFLTSENYHSLEANKKFFSFSQFKNFVECQAKAMAIIEGEHTTETSTDMLIGKYVEAYFEGQLTQFRFENPDIFLKDGITLGSRFRHADHIIEIIENDSNMMAYFDGAEQQKIFTDEIAGVPFKAKLDLYHPYKTIADLKIMKDFKWEWVWGVKMDFIMAHMYDFQGAIYRELEGNYLPYAIVAATKEKTPDKLIIELPHELLDERLRLIEKGVQKYNKIKNGEVEAVKCNKCDYCKGQKQAQILSYYDLEPYINGELKG